MNSKIWLSSPHMSGREMKYVEEAFNTNWIAPLGPNVNNFELELASYLHTENVAALSSGTAAIHLALILLGVGYQDEVICSSFTFSASANPITYQSAIPVFVDSEPLTWNMSPELLESAVKDRISKGKKPKAIILVHLYGMPAQIDEIMEISNRYQIPVIEDAAEALGSQYKKRSVGIDGKFGILSFNGNKIITTSGGGALFSNDKALIEKSRFLATQARDNAHHYQHSEIGYNYRMSNVLAGIGRGQLEVINERVSQRRTVYNFYKELFKNVEGVSFLEEPNGYYSNRWLTNILIDSKKLNGLHRESVRLKLEEYNIETRPLWKPMHLQPVFNNYPKYVDGTSEELFDTGLCLPSGSNLTEDELLRIEKVCNKIFQI